MKYTAVAFAILVNLTGCETVLNHLPGVYTIDIEQGNMIEQSMVDQLRPNMSRRQVLYIMGSPMLADSFHQKRWDYLYSAQSGGEDRIQKRISLFFEGDALVGVQGDLHPSMAPVTKQSSEATVDVPKRNLRGTMWEKISGLVEDSPSQPSTLAPANTPNQANP